MALQLPTLRAPSLEGLVLEPVQVPPPTAAQLVDRMMAACRQHGTQQHRIKGEGVVSGDDVTVRLFARMDGRYLPFSARPSMLFVAGEAASEYPGVAEALVGQRVGSQADVEGRLPVSHPRFPNRSVVWTVQVLSSVQVTPARIDDTGFRNKLGLGNDYDSIFDALAIELRKELEIGARNDLSRKLLDQVTARVDVKIDEQWVDTELLYRWWKNEGQWLQTMGLGVGERDASMRAWLSNQELRRDARARLVTVFALRSIAIEHKIEVADINDFLESIEPGSSKEPRSKQVTEALTANLTHLAVVDFLMKRAVFNA